jgi:hypothetical protein
VQPTRAFAKTHAREHPPLARRPRAHLQAKHELLLTTMIERVKSRAFLPAPRGETSSRRHTPRLPRRSTTAFAAPTWARNAPARSSPSRTRSSVASMLLLVRSGSAAPRAGGRMSAARWLCGAHNSAMGGDHDHAHDAATERKQTAHADASPSC